MDSIQLPMTHYLLPDIKFGCIGIALLGAGLTTYLVVPLIDW